MSGVTEFLLARIAEDEEEARGQIELREARYPGEAVQPGVGAYQLGGGWWLQVEPRHVLAGGEAKRRIVERHKPYRRIYGVGCETCLQPRHLSSLADGWPCDTLRLLALPYADHDDYLEEWRP